MFESFSLPYLRAAVAFLDERLSRLLPLDGGLIEFHVAEKLLDEFSRLRFDTDWQWWLQHADDAEPGLTVHRCQSSLLPVVRTLRLIRFQSQSRAWRGGPFATFQMLAERALICQPWLRSDRVRVGHWWSDRVRDKNGMSVRDACEQSLVKCWLEVEPRPVRLLAHLNDLAREMESLGEAKRRDFFADLGIDPARFDWRSVEIAEGQSEDEQSSQATGPTLCLRRAMPAHLQTYQNELASGKKPAEAARIANERHGKNLHRKSYGDQLRRRSPPAA